MNMKAVHSVKKNIRMSYRNKIRYHDPENDNRIF